MTGRRIKQPNARERALAALRGGVSMTAAAKAAGVVRSTLYSWINADRAFREAVDDAVESGTDALEDALAGKGLAMDDHSAVRACEVLLKARRPERYRERHQVEHTGVLRIDQVMQELYGRVIEGEVVEREIEGPDHG